MVKLYDCIITGGMKEQSVGEPGDWVSYDDYAALLSENERLKEKRVDLEQGLRDLYRAYVCLLESGMDRIRSLGGDCDPVDVMGQADIDLRKVRDLLALIDAHRGE